MATGIGVVLTAAAALAGLDLVHTGGGGIALVGLWAILAVPAALATGLVLGAGNATWGVGWIRHGFRALRRDPDLDRSVAAILLSAAAVGAVLALATAVLAVGLVGSVQRQAIGALLLGGAVVGLVPVLAIAALPVYRAARIVARLLPALGPLSRTVLLAVAALAGIAGAFGFVVVTRLDYRALDLGFMVALLLPVVAIAVGALWFGPLAGLRRRTPGRGIAAGIAVVTAIAIAAVGLRGQPNPTTSQAITERSFIGKRMIGALRKVMDRDRDGYSAFFGGADCDDHNPAVHPQATEIPGNGIDENCVGGDAPRADHDAKAAAVVADQPSTNLSGGQSVVVIFVDTLRFDRLGKAGYRRDGKSLTPRIDAFADASVVFDHAYAQAPNTPRSVPSFLTSRYPSQVVMADSDPLANYPTISNDNETLFEVMKRAGFTTVGQSSHFYFCDRVAYPNTCGDVVNTAGKPMHTNVIQGADLWDNSDAKSIQKSNADIAGPRIVKRTIAKLDELAQAKSKFAMIVHLFEPHSTYVPHPEFPIRGSGDTRPEKYDYEIAFEDGLVGQLLDAMDRNGLSATTTVVLMSDHGEAFGVHPGEAGWYHGMSLYNEILHVPLLFRIPGVKAATRHDVVQLIDLAPTIACLFGVTPPASWVGRCLAPALAGEAMPAAAAYAEMLPARSWKREAKSMITADAKHHVIYNITDSRWEVFDLAGDPEERRNVFNDDDSAIKPLQRALAAWIEGPLASGGGK